MLDFRFKCLKYTMDLFNTALRQVYVSGVFQRSVLLPQDAPKYRRTPQDAPGHPRTLILCNNTHEKCFTDNKNVKYEQIMVLLLNESDYRYITYKIVPVCLTIIIDFCSTPGLILCYPRTHFYTIGHMELFK